MPEAQWAGRTEFAEAASTLKVRTDQVGSQMWQEDGSLMVIFMPDEDSDEVWGARCERDAYEILREISRTQLPPEVVEAARDEADTEIGLRLMKKFGEPSG